MSYKVVLVFMKTTRGINSSWGLQTMNYASFPQHEDVHINCQRQRVLDAYIIHFIYV